MLNIQYIGALKTFKMVEENKDQRNKIPSWMASKKIIFKNSQYKK